MGSGRPPICRARARLAAAPLLRERSDLLSSRPSNQFDNWNITKRDMTLFFFFDVSNRVSSACLWARRKWCQLCNQIMMQSLETGCAGQLR